MRATLIIVTLGACRIGEHIAAPPIDAGDGAIVDGGDADGEPSADASPPGGLHAIIGERPEVHGHCDALTDRAELDDRFDPPVQEMDVTAGWGFDTAADVYNDPSYGFAPNWPTAESGRFSVRYRGRIRLDAGPHCFSIDIGATGTDIIGGRNGCAKLWLGAGAAPLVETGYGAASVEAAVACVDLEADGLHDVDFAFWYFNIFEQAKLAVRWCAGDACTPDQSLSTSIAFPRPRTP